MLARQGIKLNAKKLYRLYKENGRRCASGADASGLLAPEH
jgi:hypothetical protein